MLYQNFWIRSFINSSISSIFVFFNLISSLFLEMVLTIKTSFLDIIWRISLNLVISCVLNFIDQVIKKLSGFSRRGKGGRMSLNLLHGDRMNLYCTLQEKVIPCLEFTMEFQSNQLIYQKEYTKRQQIIYVLIHHLHEREGWGFRKISQWLNQSGIKTFRGKNWFSSSVISVLKRKHERDLMNEQIRNQHFPSKVSKFEVNYYILLINY